jgi:hypothetical protein
MAKQDGQLTFSQKETPDTEEEFIIEYQSGQEYILRAVMFNLVLATNEKGKTTVEEEVGIPGEYWTILPSYVFFIFYFFPFISFFRLFILFVS